ncbi:glutathione ABC transporter substrate-binding protein [Halalkalibacillus halophilus]|uniref:glutathione ABC transporter substrate-binding protein n=1 Tax=Halalkalibacillus halophilus TaxID=392827 RepID=UPI00040BEAD2|nr:glutathione ABC transporter substrate-binding protein [Halalkalibacillus halophilus]
MKSNKLLWLFALMLSFVLVLAACASDDDVDPEGGDDDGEDTTETDTDSDTDDEEGTEEDDAEGEAEGDADFDTEGNHLVIAVPSDVVSLDPHGSNDVPSSNARSNIYDTLVGQNEDLEIVEGLATDWEEVDETTWSFTLREGVTFHDGSEFTAEVAKANLDRILDPVVASERAFLYEMITDVEVVGDYELHITTEYPFAPLLSHLAHDAGGMMSMDVIEEDYAQAYEESGYTEEEVQELADAAEGAEEESAEAEEFNEAVGAVGEYIGQYVAQNAAGTGYFEVDERISGERLTLSRYDDYWGEAAAADAISFKVVPETSARIAELETGNSHIIQDVGPDNVDRVDGTDGVSVNMQDSVSLNYVGFNVQSEPFDDERVRQAVNLLINQEEIIDGIYDGNGIPAIGPLAPDVFGYDENVDGLGHDPERAQELLEEAGYADGFETTIWTNDNERRVDTALYVQSILGEYNIDVEVEELEWGAYLDRTANGEHDMFILGWSTVTADADYGLYALFHSSAVGSTGDRSFLENDELDELLDAGRREADPEARQEIYSEAQELLTELAPMAYLNHQTYLTGVSDEVSGFSVDPLGIFQLHEATIE